MNDSHVKSAIESCAEQQIMKSNPYIRFLSFVLPILLCSMMSAAQNSKSAVPDARATAQGTALLQRAYAIAGAGAVHDVTLTGRVRRVAGSEDEEGTVVLKALDTGETEIEYNLPSGSLSEVRFNSGTRPAGKWRGPDGTSHDLAPHNLAADAVWFCPALLVRRLGEAPGLVASEDEHGRLAVSRQIPDSKLPAKARELARRASEMRIELDPSTLLPRTLSFNTHPDNDAGLDVPVEIRFADYRAINGVPIPFSVQRYLNNSLILDLKFEAAVVNSGLSVNSFNVQ